MSTGLALLLLTAHSVFNVVSQYHARYVTSYIAIVNFVFAPVTSRHRWPKEAVSGQTNCKEERDIIIVEYSYIAVVASYILNCIQ